MFLKRGMDHCDPKNPLEYSGVRQLLTRSAGLHFQAHSDDIDPIDLIEGGWANRFQTFLFRNKLSFA